MSIIGEAATAKVNIPEPDYYLKILHDSDNNIVSADIKLKGSVPSSLFRSNTHLTSVKLHDTLTGVGTYAFEGCTALSLSELPSSIVSLGSYAFNNSGVSISRYGGTLVNSYAFANCLNITTMDLFVVSGLSSPSITYNVFTGCTNLKTLIVRYSSVRPLSLSALSGVSLQHIYVPSNLVSSYQSATTWKKYASIIEAIPI